MSPKLQELRAQARMLSPTDKLALAESLLDDLDAIDPAIEKAWEEEVGRRIEADEQGLLETFSHEDVTSGLGKGNFHGRILRIAPIS